MLKRTLSFCDKENLESKKLKEQDYYGLPLSIKEILQKQNNFEKLDQFQLYVLEELNFSKKNSILYVPKNGGIPYIFEILILKEILINKKDVLYIQPFTTSVKDKLKSFQAFSLEFDFITEEYANDKGKLPPFKNLIQNTLYVATIEKAHLLVINLLKEKRLDEIGLIIFDEINILNEYSTRSIFIESLLSLFSISKKLKLFYGRVIMMSSSINNYESVSVLMNAKIEKNNLKPKEIKETILIEGKVEEYIFDKKTLIPFKTLSKNNLNDLEVLSELVNQKSLKNLIQIFCSNKEDSRKMVSSLINFLDGKLLYHKTTEKNKVLFELEKISSGQICPILEKSIPLGIAYLNADLTFKEREIIENSFKNKTLCCIVSTLLLSGNINSFANYIIIKDPYIGRYFINFKQYKYMTGRTVFFTKNRESILLTKPVDYSLVQKVLNTDENLNVKSTLHNENDGLSRIILNLVCLELAKTKEEIISYIKSHTLFGIESSSNKNFDQTIADIIKKLVKSKLIKITNKEKKININRIGSGIVKNIIDIDKCINLYSEFKKINQKIKVNSAFHFLYVCSLLFQEYQLIRYPNSAYLCEMFFNLSKEEKDAALLFGFTEYFVIKYQTVLIPNERMEKLYLILIVYQTWKNQNLANKIFQISNGSLEKIMKIISLNQLSLLSFVGELDEFLELKKLLKNFSLN